MSTIRKWVGIAGAAVLALFLSGCNLFDGVDTSLTDRSEDQQVDEGHIALNSGDYELAKEIFQTLYKTNSARAEIVQGLGESMAGFSNFQAITILNALQNGPSGYDKAPVTFKTAPLIKNRQNLEQAIAVLMGNHTPSRSDYLSRGLMRIPTAAKILLEKYDTNRNGKLDVNDTIAFDTNDKTIASWPFLYRDLVTGPSATGNTLEQSFGDLVNGFDGQGATWTFFTPVNNKQMAGTFTSINKSTIFAVGDLTERLKTANLYWNIHAASFAAAIRDLDGAE